MTEFKGMQLNLQNKEVPMSKLEVESYADVMTTEQFINNCDFGCFIPSDGDGYLIIDGKETGKSVWSAIFNHDKDLLESASHVAWYNK